MNPMRCEKCKGVFLGYFDVLPVILLGNVHATLCSPCQRDFDAYLHANHREEYAQLVALNIVVQGEPVTLEDAKSFTETAFRMREYALAWLNKESESQTP